MYIFTLFPVHACQLFAQIKNYRDLPSKPVEETGWTYRPPTPPALQLSQGVQVLSPESNGAGGSRDSKGHTAHAGLCQY